MALQDRTGQKVPPVVFRTRVSNTWKDISTDDLFEGKKVVVFSLPGTFTPTCSSSHLSHYNELFDVFRKNDVDAVYCMSVNDIFAMSAWATEEESDSICMILNGSGESTGDMGILVDKENLGFGKRSWRYSILVSDGVVEKIFIEPEESGDPFKMSDADTMLKFIAPDWKAQESVAIFTKPGCQFCAEAKKALQDKGLSYEEIVLSKDATITSVRAVTDKMTAPQVFIDDKYIGGSEGLETYLAKS